MRPRLSPQIAEDLGAGEPHNPQLQRLMELALWHSQAGNVPAAILSCETALLIDAENTSALSLLGCLYERQGDVDKAITVFERVVQVNPDSEADAEKLNALRRGEYLPPVLQPFGYRWLPPALVTSFPKSKPLRMGIGVAAALLIFGGGIAAMTLRNNASVVPSAISADTAPPASRITAPPNGSPSNPLPTRIASATAASSQIPLTVVPAASHSINGDTIAVKPSVAPTAMPRVSRLANQLSINSRQGRVPPLNKAATGNSFVPSVAAIRPLDGSVVNIASGATVPQHTVLIAPANSAQTVQGGAPAAMGASGDADQPPAPESHVYVHVHPDSLPSARPMTAADLSVSQPSSSGSAPVTQSRGVGLQSQALQAQQHGSYRVAARLYHAAVGAYRAEINRGEFVSEAQRGIEACETGLQICQENQ